MLGLKESVTGRIHPAFYPTVSFGKDPSRCDVVLNETAAGRKHFELTVADNARMVHISDCGSALGTLVNGERLQEDTKRRLAVNDQIVVGQAAFTVVEFGIGNEGLEHARDKLLRVGIECDRIRAKEGFEGLSTTQLKTLEKYQDEIQRLKQTVTDLANGGSGKASNEENPDDQYWDVNVAEDDGTSTAFLDLTEKKSNQATPVETYDSLMRKIKDLDKECADIEADIRALGEQKGKGAEDEEDELEKFMAANEQDIKSADMEKAQKKLKTAQDERARCQALADLARPALHRLAPASTMSNVVPTSKLNSALPFEQAPVRPTSNTASSSAPSKSKVDQIFSRPAAPVVRPAVSAKFRVIQEKVDDDGDADDPKRQKQSNVTDEEQDPVWVPPANQRGDGKTTVNQRYGY